MYYVYLIKSINFPDQVYIGFATDLKERLKTHNSGKSIHTNKFTLWKIKNYIGFETQDKALEFEKFLKSGNGRIFAKKHF